MRFNRTTDERGSLVVATVQPLFPLPGVYPAWRRKVLPQQRRNKRRPLTKRTPPWSGGALEAGEGLLRLAPTWVPRSFLMPGRRIKLAPQDVYALGAHRGGIDERWFASTTHAANELALEDEGLSYVVHEGKRTFTLREAVAQEGAKLVGEPDLGPLSSLARVQ